MDYMVHSLSPLSMLVYSLATFPFPHHPRVHRAQARRYPSPLHSSPGALISFDSPPPLPLPLHSHSPSLDHHTS